VCWISPIAGHPKVAAAVVLGLPWLVPAGRAFGPKLIIVSMGVNAEAPARRYWGLVLA